MGQAKIVSNLGAGQYQVTILRDFARAKTRLALIDADIVKIDAEIVKLEAELLPLQAALIPLQAALDAISQNQNDLSGDLPDLSQAINDYGLALEAAKTNVVTLKGQRSILAVDAAKDVKAKVQLESKIADLQREIERYPGIAERINERINDFQADLTALIADLNAVEAKKTEFFTTDLPAAKVALDEAAAALNNPRLDPAVYQFTLEIFEKAQADYDAALARYDGYKKEFNDLKQQIGEVNAAIVQAETDLKTAQVAYAGNLELLATAETDLAALENVIVVNGNTLSGYDVLIASATTTYNTAKNNYTTAKEQTDNIFKLLADGLKDYKKALTEWATAKKEANAKQLEIDKQKLLKAGKTKDKTSINAALADEFKPATLWCADWSLELATGTTVGTIELPDDTMGYTPTQNIKPGGELMIGNETKPTFIQPVISSGAPATFFNLAVLPGVQKWKPRYRKATLLSKNGNFGVIQLDTAYSSQHPKGNDLNINSKGVYHNVPIVYMGCHGSVFNVNDRVIVDFGGNPDTPRIIGFVDHPRECNETGNSEVKYFAHWFIYADGDQGGFSDTPYQTCDTTDYFSNPTKTGPAEGGHMGNNLIISSDDVPHFVGPLHYIDELELRHYKKTNPVYPNELQWGMTYFANAIAKRFVAYIEKRTIYYDEHGNVISFTRSYVSGNITGTITVIAQSEHGLLSCDGGTFTINANCAAGGSSTGAVTGSIRTRRAASCGDDWTVLPARNITGSSSAVSGLTLSDLDFGDKTISGDYAGGGCSLLDTDDVQRSWAVVSADAGSVVLSPHPDGYLPKVPNPGQLVTFNLGALQEYSSGNADTLSATSLTDNNANWLPGCFSGSQIAITAPGYNYLVDVSSNTERTISFSALPVSPPSSGAYRVRLKALAEIDEYEVADTLTLRYSDNVGFTH